VRSVGIAGILFAALFGVALFTGTPAMAAVPLTGSASGSLTQGPDRTWTTTIYLDTTALCQQQPTAGQVPPSFELVTTGSQGTVTDSPSSTPPLPVFGSQGCAPGATPQTQVELTFTLTGVPQSAVLVVTPPAALEQAGDTPISIILTVHRHVSGLQYVGIPAYCGLGFAALLIILTTIFGLSWIRGHGRRNKARAFLRMKLYAASTWSFSDSWATNFTALTTLLVALSTAVGAVDGLLPGVDIGWFSLLFVSAGSVTGIAPIVFGVLNYWYSRPDPLVSGMAAIVADYSAADSDPRQRLVTITLPAGGSVTLNGDVALGNGRTLAPDASRTFPLDIGTVITVLKGDRAGPGDRQQVLALPGGSGLAARGGRPLTLSGPLSVPATAILSAPARMRVRARKTAGVIAAGTVITASAGAGFSFLGKADITVLDGAEVEAPVGDVVVPARLLPSGSDRRFEVPPSGEVVATRMWVMLLASCFTVFGIGAQIGIVGWVLGGELSTATSAAHGLIIAGTVIAPMLFLAYSVLSILSLIEVPAGKVPRRGQSTSFML